MPTDYEAKAREIIAHAQDCTRQASIRKIKDAIRAAADDRSEYVAALEAVAKAAGKVVTYYDNPDEDRGYTASLRTALARLAAADEARREEREPIMGRGTHICGGMARAWAQDKCGLCGDGPVLNPMPTDHEAMAREIAQGIRYVSEAGLGVRGFSSHHVDAIVAAFARALRAAADEAPSGSASRRSRPMSRSEIDVVADAIGRADADDRGRMPNRRRLLKMARAAIDALARLAQAKPAEDALPPIPRNFVVDPSIPEGEIHFKDGKRTVGKIVNVKPAEESPSLDDPCPHPARKGRHEVYKSASGLFCRACGAVPKRPAEDAPACCVYHGTGGNWWHECGGDDATQWHKGKEGGA